MENGNKQAKGSREKYIKLLAEKYPTKEAVYTELIYLQSMLGLPKGVEHFMSDLHGEYDTFYHILNNCSGVIKEKVDYVFGVRLTDEQKAEFCTLIYYPKEKIERMRIERKNTPEWYRENLAHLLELAKLMSYKYPISKVESFIPKRYEGTIRDLLNTRPEADNAQFVYNKRMLNMIVQIDAGADFIVALTVLIKRLAVDRLHIVGDFFDRGSRPDAIIEKLMHHYSLDIQWGNHDVLWMGAACGSEACIAVVVRNNLRYNNTDVLERGYAISLRPLTLFATKMYPQEENAVKASEVAISMIMFKLEGQVIQRNPDYHMESRLLLSQIDYSDYTLTIDGKKHQLDKRYFVTVDPKDPYKLTEEEQEIINHLKSFFVGSEVLKRHIDFLYEKGSMYTCYNGNLLFHGCVPMQDDGTFTELTFHGRKYTGREFFDYCDACARQARFSHEQPAIDFLWYLWCGRQSPLSGREFKTFERMMVEDKSTWKEPSDAYFKLINDAAVCEHVLEEFGLNPKRGHIINGHVPVKVKAGETPVKAGGKAIIIDGGFCRAYHNKTGISGYTLIYNSRGLRLLEHEKIADVRLALKENGDIESVSSMVELQAMHTTVGDTDYGREMKEKITDLYNLLLAYQNGAVGPRV